ncbi:MAG: protoporphyrinogen oxidase HemJ [Proteobacteria bacterium]|nr:protoporphyrinogen oxidase HemJ [Pseudomonadota bacterium]
MMYLTVKAFHLIALVSWFAGLFYLPRLFVYHAAHQGEAANHAMLCTMERKLYRYIMNPAMMATWTFGLILVVMEPGWLTGQGWLHAKLLLVLILTGYHVSLGRMVKTFAKGGNTRNHTFYRYYNEIPTILLVLVVLLVVLKPF